MRVRAIVSRTDDLDFSRWDESRESRE